MDDFEAMAEDLEEVQPDIEATVVELKAEDGICREEGYVGLCGGLCSAGPPHPVFKNCVLKVGEQVLCSAPDFPGTNNIS